MNKSYEILKLKTQNVMAILMIAFWIAFVITLMTVKVPYENKEILNTVLLVLSNITAGMAVHFFGGKKEEEVKV